MNLRAVLALFLLTGSAVVAAVSPPAFTGTEVSVESQSRRFTVRGPAAADTPRNRPMRSTSRALLRLDPSSVAVSAERVKGALFTELGVKDRFERQRISRTMEPGRINIRLSPQNPPIGAVIRAPVEGGWTYRLDLPVQMSAHDFNTTLAEVLLVDLVNPTSMDAVDLPPWLGTGLVAHLEESSERPLAIDSGLTVRTERVGLFPTERLRAIFLKRPALTFDELSWPSALSPETSGLFKPSAHLLVHELLRLQNGRDCLRAMVEKLGHYRNWQFAFYEAFAEHFKEPKDVEKWWAIRLATLTGRDPAKLWPVPESLSRIEQVLRVPVQVQTGAAVLPASSTVNLQSAVKEWHYTQERVVLGRVLRDLGQLRNRVAPEAIETLDRYRETIESYLDSRDPLRQKERNKSGTASSALFEQRRFQRRLDELDAQRDQLRQRHLAELALGEAERRVAITNALQRAGTRTSVPAGKVR